MISHLRASRPVVSVSRMTPPQGKAGSHIGHDRAGFKLSQYPVATRCLQRGKHLGFEGRSMLPAGPVSLGSRGCWSHISGKHVELRGHPVPIVKCSNSKAPVAL